MSNTLTAQRALRTLADDYGCDATVEAIARRVYKNTDCGAYFDIVGNDVVVGTIVEGHDAEHTVELALDDYKNDNAGLCCFTSDFYAALMGCEAFADQVLGFNDDDDGLYSEMYGDNGIDLLY